MILGVVMLISYIATANMNVEVVEAAKIKTKNGFTYDTNMYRVNWNESSMLLCQAKDGTILGMYRIYVGCATSRKKDRNGYYTQQILANVQMFPQEGKLPEMNDHLLLMQKAKGSTKPGSFEGMSQYIKLTYDFNEDYCDYIAIEPQVRSGSTSYTTTNGFSIGGGIEVGGSKEGVQGLVSLNGEYIVSETNTIEKKSLEIMTKFLENRTYKWVADYKSSNNNAINAYLKGSSVQYFTGKWYTKRPKKLQPTVNYDIRFGASLYGCNYRLTREETGYSLVRKTGKINLKY